MFSKVGVQYFINMTLLKNSSSFFILVRVVVDLKPVLGTLDIAGHQCIVYIVLILFFFLMILL